MLSGEFRPHFMSVCNPHGGLFGFAGSRSAIRFASVYECPAIQSAMNRHGKRAPLGTTDGPSVPGPSEWSINETAEYKTLRFATQSFPSMWFSHLFILHILYSPTSSDMMFA